MAFLFGISFKGLLTLFANVVLFVFMFTFTCSERLLVQRVLKSQMVQMDFLGFL